MNRRWFLLLIALVTALTLLSFDLPLTQLDGWAADRLQELRGPRPAPRKIVLLEYDETTRNQAAEADLIDQPGLEDLQFWPLPRQLWGKVLERLRLLDVDAVGFDVLFDEPRVGDERFAEGLKRFGRPVVLAVGVDDSDEGSFGLSSGLLRPIARLRDAGSAVSEAHISVLGRLGGVVRETPRSYREIKHHLNELDLPPSLSERLHDSTNHLGETSAADPDQWLDLLVFYGPPGVFPTTSLWDLIENSGFERLQSSGSLRGATVLIANTTPEARDRHPTPFARLSGMPGVEIHATALANLREDARLSLLRRRGWVDWLLVAWAVGLAAFCLRLERPVLRAGLAVALVGLGFGLSLIALSAFSRLPPMGSWTAITLLTGLVSAGEGTAKIQRSRRRMRMALSRYLSPSVLEEISKSSKDFDVTLGGEACDVVVLFTDVRGFTAMTTQSTRDGRVGDFVRQLNRYFTVVVEELLANNATVDKYIGDAVLAYFGAPLQREPDENARLAVDAARRITVALDRLNLEWQQQGIEPWNQVIVLSYGSVICGNIGSPNRLDFTIIGDAVNRASRLEAVAKQFQVPIVATADVVELAGLQSESECLGHFQIRGQEGALPIYSISVKSDLS